MADKNHATEYTVQQRFSGVKAIWQSTNINRKKLISKWQKLLIGLIFWFKHHQTRMNHVLVSFLIVTYHRISIAAPEEVSGFLLEAVIYVHRAHVLG